MNLVDNNTDIFFFIFLLLFNIIFFIYFNKISTFLKLNDIADNVRKFQESPIPLIGGVLLFINITFISAYALTDLITPKSNNLFLNYRELYSFYITSTLIFLVGIYDDKYTLKPNTKFIYLFIILLMALLIDNNMTLKNIYVDYLNRSIPLYNFSIFFTILCFLLFINAVNMFDGINMQVGIYVFLILLFFIISKISVFLCVGLMFPIIVFLILNFKGRTFLGDNGSLLIAYVLGYIFIKSYNDNQIKDIETIFVIMMIPGLDMLRLFFTRIMQGKNAFHPDTNHIHHRFTKFYGKKSVFIIQFLIVMPAIAYLFVNKSILIIIIGIFVYFFMIYFAKTKIIN